VPNLNVGFVGLGNMGWPMAKNLVRAGFQLTVRDADSERERRFTAEHACQVGDDPAAFQHVDAVVTMLPTGRIVRDVMLDWGGGLGRKLPRGATVIDMSSSDPTGTRQLGRALADTGVSLIDAPVSGGVPKATDGTLAIMIGGNDEAAIARARPLFDVMGKKLFFTGPLGSGHAMKALNNYVAATGFTAAAEALIIGTKFGLDPAVMVDVLNASTGRNFSTEYTLKAHVLPRTFATGFALGLLAKDVAIAAELAREIGVDAPVCQLLQQRWADALAAVGGALDHSTAIKRWEQVNNIELPVRRSSG
jgi:3-hydroxyisobutyrate dehydrogenase